MWEPFRARIEAPSKSRKRGEPEETRDIHFVLLKEVEDQLEPVGEHVARDIPISKLPLAFQSWRLPGPGIVEGRPSSDKIEGVQWARNREQELQTY